MNVEELADKLAERVQKALKDDVVAELMVMQFTKQLIMTYAPIVQMCKVKNDPELTKAIRNFILGAIATVCLDLNDPITIQDLAEYMTVEKKED